MKKETKKLKDLEVEGSIVLKDKAGNNRIILDADNNGTPMIMLKGEGASRLDIAIYGTMSRIEVIRGNGNIAMAIVVGDHSEQIVLYDQNKLLSLVWYSTLRYS